MNSVRVCELKVGLLIALLVGLVGQISAQSKSENISYSHEQWPTRWSSAIQQQQTSKFPNRQVVETALAELPESVSDQDLFYSPPAGRQYSVGRGRNNNYKRGYTAQQFSRNQGQYIRDAAFAYQSAGRGNNYGTPNYMRPYNASMPVMDPVLGHPSFPLPMMAAPGVYPMGMMPFSVMPFGAMPFGIMPFGFPTGANYWTSPYGFR